MRLIDAECPELMETIGRREFRTRTDVQDWLDKAPTVDAVIRKKGILIPTTRNDHYGPYQVFQCSFCGAIVAPADCYCRKCGVELEMPYSE